MEASVDLYLTAEPLAAIEDLALPSRQEPERRASRTAVLPRGAAATAERERDSLYEALIGSGSLALAAIDDGSIRFASPAFLRLLGLPSAQGETGTSWCRRIHSADRPRICVLLAEALQDAQPLSTSCMITEPGGSAVRVHLAGYPAGPQSPGVYTLLLHVDVSSRTAPPAPRLPAPVRRAFARGRNEILDRAGELLVDAWLKSESLAILAVGLHAPAAGWTTQTRLQAETELLERLRPCLRDGDIIGRNGDDGLLIAIPNLSGASSAGIVAGRLMESACAKGAAGDSPSDPEWNIGIALFPDDDQELSGLLTHAGAALEFARQCGANRYSLAETSLNLSLIPDPMPWEATLRAGLAEVDAQHSRVLDELRALSHDIGTSADLPALRAGLERIVQGLIADFDLEDTLMADHPGPLVDAHRREHDRVLCNLRFIDHADARQGLALATQFLYQWLAEHVREYDVPLVVSTYRPLW